MTPHLGKHRKLSPDRGALCLGLTLALSAPLAQGQIAAGGNVSLSASTGSGTASNAGGNITSAPVQASIGTSVAQPTAAPAARVPLTNEQLTAVVVIVGDQVSGTGFVAKLHGQSFIVISPHALSGNKKFTATGLDGTKYPTDGALYGAKDYGVLILQIPDALARHFLDIDGDPQNDTKAQALVSAPGKPDAMGVATQIDGQLTGFGPTMVETTLKFIVGNDGSPIVYRPTGKVVGIAVELPAANLDELNNASNPASHHWASYRLDNIPADTGWVKLDWASFSNAGVQLRKLDDETRFLSGYLSTHKIPSTTDAQINAEVDTFRKNTATAISQKDQVNFIWYVKTFLQHVQDISQANLKTLDAESLDPYHAALLKNDHALWTELDKSIADANKQVSDSMQNALDHK